MKASALHIQRLVDGNAVSFPAKGEEAIVGSYTYSGKRMGGAPTLTATIYYERPLDDDWTYDEFVEFLGERFFVTSIPSSSKDNESMMYKHEIVFTSRREILDNTLFFDVVSDYDKDTHGGDRYVSNQTKFQFGGTIREFVSRINSALAYCGLYFPQKAQGDRGYYVVVDNGYGTDDVKEISFEDEYITNVIQLINTEFELDYYWVGTVCHVGKVQHDLTDNDEDIVRYGRNDALLSISRENANTKIVDMITGRGSSDNIPEYYPNDGEFGLAVFNTANIDKEDVTVNLEKLYALDNPIGRTFTFCKIKDGQYDNTIDVYVSEVWSNYQPCFKEFSQKWHIGHCDAGTRIKLSGIWCEVRYEKHQCDNLFAIVESSYSIVVDGTRTEKVSLDDNFVCPVPGDYKFVHLVSYYVKEREQVSDGDHTGGYLNIVASIQGSIGVSCQKSDGELWFYSEGMSFRYDDGGIIFADISKAVPAICGMEYYNGFVPYGLTGEETASKVEIKDRKFVFPSQNLMPSIYRKSGGANRFYLAENGKYEKPDGSGEFYQFANLYKVGKPHQGSVSFDDIKPTINGIRNDVIQSDGLGQLFGEIADVAFDAKDNDIKDDSGNYIHPYFYLKLHKFSGEFGFDLFASALASDTAKINLVDSIGCPACSFEIQTHKSSDGKKFYNPVSTDAIGNLKKIDGKETGDYILSPDEAASDTYNQDSRKHELWIALKKDASTLGIIMPNAANNFKPKKGEKFVITGIKAPYSLVTAAEKRLDDALIKYMFENNEDQFNINVKFSRVFLQENPSFASRLNENSKIKVEYNGKQYELFVSSFTVKAENSVLMEVDVELVKSLEITQSDVKNIVDSVKGEVVRPLANLAGGGGSNINMSITDKAYLSKLHDDSTKYRLTVGEFQSNGRATVKGDVIVSDSGTFVSGAEGHGTRLGNDGMCETDIVKLRGYLGTPNFVDGFNGNGFKLWIDDSKLANLTLDRLTVRQTMVIFELLIEKIRSVGGQICVSAANGKIKSVKEYEDNYVIEFEQENTFVAHDLVRCQTFTGKNLKSYWAEVASVTKDGVIIPKSEFTNSLPAVGDECVLMGNTINTKRQNLVLISATEDGNPRIDVMNGVNHKGFDKSLRARLGNLDGINDDWFPASNQPNGDGLYCDNAFLKGTFLLETGEDVKTRFEITDGKIESAVEGVRQDLMPDRGYLSNPSFNEGFDKWGTQNETVFFLVGNKWIYANNNVLSKRGDSAIVVKDMGRTVVHIKNKYICQKNKNLAKKPDMPTNADGTKEAQPVYLAFFYRCATAGKLAVTFEGVDKTGFADFESFNIEQEVGVTDGYQQFTCEGIWNGTGDFKLSFTGEIYLYMLVLSTDKVDSLTYKYRTLFEQSDKLINIAAQNFDKDGNVLADSGIMVKPTGVGIYSQGSDGKFALIGVEVKGEDGKSSIKLFADNIQLEGYATINGNFKIDKEGNMDAKNGRYEGTVVANSGKFIGAIGSPYNNVGAAQTQWPSVDTGMNVMVSDTKRAEAGLVLPAYKEIDGVECDVINATATDTFINIPSNNDPTQCLLYRNTHITSVKLGGNFCRVRLKAFVQPGADGCSWTILNTSDFELATDVDLKYIYAKSVLNPSVLN